jgi:hypothetical protein
MQALETFLHVVHLDAFVEGHEVLEEEWHRLKRIPERENEAKILKGLINASTALALARKGKNDGAKRVWQTFEKYAPLIDTTDSPFTPLYRQAVTLLYEKHLRYMEDVKNQIKRQYP